MMKSLRGEIFISLVFILSFVYEIKVFADYHEYCCCLFDKFFQKNNVVNLTKELDFYSDKNIFLFTGEIETDQNKIYVIYGNINPEKNHYVFGKVFWAQTIIIDKKELEEFKISLKKHIEECWKHNTDRNVVNTQYDKCKNGCRMKEYEAKFLKNKFFNVSSEKKCEYIKKTFFPIYKKGGKVIYKHKRKESWEDFFKIIKNKFLNEKGEQIFSENENKKYTYLYLLTDKRILELGYNIAKKNLFLIEYDSFSYYNHAKIFFWFLENIKKTNIKLKIDSNKIIWEIPTKYWIDNNLWNISEKINDNFILQLWKDILACYMNENHNYEQNFYEKEDLL